MLLWSKNSCATASTVPAEVPSAQVHTPPDLYGRYPLAQGSAANESVAVDARIPPESERPVPIEICSTGPLAVVVRPSNLAVAIFSSLLKVIPPSAIFCETIVLFAIFAEVTAWFAIVAATEPVPEAVTSPVSAVMPEPATPRVCHPVPLQYSRFPVR